MKTKGEISCKAQISRKKRKSRKLLKLQKVKTKCMNWTTGKYKIVTSRILTETSFSIRKKTSEKANYFKMEDLHKYKKWIWIVEIAQSCRMSCVLKGVQIKNESQCIISIHSMGFELFPHSAWKRSADGKTEKLLKKAFESSNQAPLFRNHWWFKFSDRKHTTMG